MIPSLIVGNVMSGLFRYIILPLCLWWLITGGYETLIPEKNEDSHLYVETPVPAKPIQEREAPRIVPPKVIKREYSERNAKPETTKELRKSAVTETKCDLLTANLIAAETNNASIDTKSLTEWTSCRVSDSEKQRLLRYSLIDAKQDKLIERALGVSSLYKQTYPKDPYPLFEEAEIYQISGSPERSLESFISAFKLSRAKSEIDPRYFMTALKSMQRLGLICEQQQLLTSMLALNQLNEEVKRSISNQIQILKPKCG
jgi:hypothetical protein